MKRFKKVQKKISLFNLGSDDEGMNKLTHAGENLDEIDDYNEPMEISDEEDERMAKEIVQKYHFGGDKTEEPGAPEKKKTLKQIYEEIIVKSKLHKMERQRNKEKNDCKTMELDE